MRLGAVQYVNVTNLEELKGFENQFSFIISTVPAKYNPVIYMKMLKMGGEMAIVGLPSYENMPQITLDSFIFNPNRKVYGSLIGGIAETQEMLDYSVANHIYPEVEIINADGRSLDDAYNKIVDGKVKFRYVIDMKTLK